MTEQGAQNPENTSQYWSLNKASKELGINKSTLSTDASKGKIQWHPQPDGSRKLFVPELYTFYAERLKNRTERAERVLNVGIRPENEPPEHNENSELNPTVKAQSEMLELMKAQIEDLRNDRDQWRAQAERTGQQLTEALTAIKMLPAPAEQQPPTPTAKPGFLARLFGGRA